MKRTLTALCPLVLLCGCALLVACGGATNDDDPVAEGISIADAWSRATPGPVGAVFMQLTNAGGEADRLVSVRSDAAEFSEIHRSSMVGDQMRMEPLPDGIDVPAGETMPFEPGGLHIMLMKLHAALEEDATFQLTLVFENAGEQTIDVAVRPADAGADGQAH